MANTFQVLTWMEELTDGGWIIRDPLQLDHPEDIPPLAVWMDLQETYCLD